jgi:hypothetical protein
METAPSATMETTPSATMETTPSATMETTSAAAAESAATETVAPGTAETAATNAIRVSSEPGRTTAGWVAGTVARSEMMVTAAAVTAVTAITAITIAEPVVRSSEGKAWGVEAPAEGIVENSVVRDKCIGVEPRVPIPSVAIPATGI